MSTELSKQQSNTQAEFTWHLLRSYIDPYQWAFDRPDKAPRKEEIYHAKSNRGKKGCCTFQRTGDYSYKYRLPVLGQWASQNAISKKRKLYYVSSPEHGRILVYIDVDCHRHWQSDADALQARQLIAASGLAAYWVNSSRGANGYIKLCTGGVDPSEVNQILAQLQKALQSLLANHGCLADVEIKGTVGYVSGDQWKWGLFGKLPIHSAEWNAEDFAYTKRTTLAELQGLVVNLEATADQTRLAEVTAKKKQLDSQPHIEGKRCLFTDSIAQDLDRRGLLFKAQCLREETEDGRSWIPASLLNEQPEPAPKEPERIEPEPSPVSDEPVAVSRGVIPAFHVAAGLSIEPDSFVRQRMALLALCRAAKRVVTVEEALDYVKRERLHTGNWQENLGRRRCRVASILKFIARTFDASKIKDGKVELGRFDYVAAKYAAKMQGVSAEWVSVALSIIDFCLKHPNADGSLPQERAKTLWKSLNIDLAWDDLKWKTLRGVLRRAKVVTVDGIYYPGKAMHWSVGDFFPGRHNYAGIKVKTQKRRPYRVQVSPYSIERRTTAIHKTLHGVCARITPQMLIAENAKPPP